MRPFAKCIFILMISASMSLFAHPKGISSRYEFYKFSNSKPHMILDCNSFFNSTELLLFLNAYGQLKGVALPMWHDYRPERHSVVLTNIESGANCAVVINAGKVIGRLSMQSPLVIENGLFNFYMALKNGQKFPTELSSFLKSSGIDLSLIYNLSLMKLGSKAPGDEEKLTLQEYMDVFVHELFHLVSAVPADFKIPGGLMWPTWAQMPDRWQVAKLCYVSDKAKPYYLKERQSATIMIQSMFLSHNQNQAIEYGRQYTQYRKARYQALANVRVPSAHEPGGVSCEKAEAIMEMVEGLAQYTAVGTMLVLKFYNFTDVMNLMSWEDPNGWFYYSAMAQMLIVNRLSANLITIITRRIAPSANYDRGVFYEFQKIIK